MTKMKALTTNVSEEFAKKVDQARVDRSGLILTRSDAMKVLLTEALQAREKTE